MLINFLICFIIAVPSMWLLNWYLGSKLTGTSLENHQVQTKQFLRMSIPLWLIFVAMAGQQIVDLYPVSREDRAFCFGFIIASDLFLLALIIHNLVLQMRQMQVKRQQQAQAIRQSLDNQTGDEFERVRGLLVAGLKIRAVQLYRQQTGESIEASRAAIEQMESRAKLAGSA